jgi:hypothetical protein
MWQKECPARAGQFRLRKEASGRSLHGTWTKLTTPAGSVPDWHPWPAAVRWTRLEFNILVKSTTAR